MTAWTPEETLQGRTDWNIVQNGGFVRLADAAQQERVLDELRPWGWHVVALDASGWSNDGPMYDDVARTLDFPDYFGRNGNALRDCLRDVAERDYGWPVGAQGLAFVIDAASASWEPELPVASLLEQLGELIENAARFGNRVIVLVRTDAVSLSIARPPITAL